MGGLWCDYERSAAGGLVVGSPRNQQTNIPGLYAIGECEYQYHGANRLGANSLVACIFSGLIVAPGVIRYVGNLPAARRRSSRRRCSIKRRCVTWPPTGRCSLGLAAVRISTRARGIGTADDPHGDRCAAQPGPAAACAAVNDLRSKPGDARFPTPATGSTRTWSSPGRWRTCSPWPRRSSEASARDECRGAHYKPEFAMPDVAAGDSDRRPPAGGAMGRSFQENTRQWLKTTVAGFRRRPAGDSLRGRGHVVDSAASAALRRGRRKLVEHVWTQRQDRKNRPPT